MWTAPISQGRGSANLVAHPRDRAHRGIASVAWTLGALAEDGVRPIIFYNRVAYCRQPQVKGWSMMVNSIINNWRMEDVWLDR
jgi:hypothetical protein